MALSRKGISFKVSLKSGHQSDFTNTGTVKELHASKIIPLPSWGLSMIGVG